MGWSVTHNRCSMVVTAAAVVSIVIAAICILIYRVVFPTILSFPWGKPSDNTRQCKQEKERTVIFAGSFNPPHCGHLVMLRYLADRYGRVICCIGVNPNKKYPVSPQTRAQILRDMLSGDGSTDKTTNNVQVEVVTGYIWRYARTQNATLFFRGIRTWAVDGPEERHLQILNSWGPLLLGRIWPLKTIFLEGDPRYRDVSSTRTRAICDDVCRRRRELGKSDVTNDDEELLRLIDELSKLVPHCIADKIVEAYGSNS